MANPTAQSISDALNGQNLPTPSPAFLATILTPSGPSQRVPALNALAATARHRILSSDLTTPSLLSPTTTSLPADLSNVQIQSRTLPSDVHVQVLDIDDLGRSKWDQIDSLESERKGETRKGREVIRVVSSTAAEGTVDLGSTASTQSSAVSNATAGKGPFKLLLQDWKGQEIYGFELRKVEKIAYPPEMSIGCKLLLRKGAKIARGVVLLEPSTVVVIGGKLETADQIWRKGREAELRKRTTAESEAGNTPSVRSRR